MFHEYCSLAGNANRYTHFMWIRLNSAYEIMAGGTLIQKIGL